MGKTVDERIRDLYMDDRTAVGNPDEEGMVRRVSNDLVAYIGGAVKSLTAATSGITEGQHEALDRLTHEVNESSFDELTYSEGRVTYYIVWTSAAKTKKIREEQYTYAVGKVTQVVTIQYDDDGVEKERLTEVYAYSGNNITSVTRTKA